MKIILESCERDQMRFPSAGDGDWTWEGDTLHIRVVPQEDDNHTFLFALHEAVEAWLCKNDGVSEEAVDAFDNSRAEYCALYGLEQGDMDDAPYREQHRKAMLLEHLMANFMGLSGYGEIR